jgi:hypothetical protein
MVGTGKISGKARMSKGLVTRLVSGLFGVAAGFKQKSMARREKAAREMKHGAVSAGLQGSSLCEDGLTIDPASANVPCRACRNGEIADR